MSIASWWKRLLEWLAPTIDEPGDRLNVRRAAEADIGGIVSLLTDDGRTSWAAGLAVRIVTPLSGEKTCVATLGDQIAGVMAYNVSGSAVDVMALVVRPNLRGRGIGTHLLSLLAEFARAEDLSVVATVESRDGDGIAWLRRRGLRPLRMCGGSPYAEEDEHRGEVRFFELPTDGSIEVSR